MVIEGTTASGDPYTTLMNTLKSIVYYKYINPEANLIAAGDDVILGGD